MSSRRINRSQHRKKIGEQRRAKASKQVPRSHSSTLPHRTHVLDSGKQESDNGVKHLQVKRKK
jgi:hypothetical protein